jgi:hypothetical protein
MKLITVVVKFVFKHFLRGNNDTRVLSKLAMDYNQDYTHCGTSVTDRC